MTSQNLLYIESSQVDYKELLEEKKPRSWLKSVSAFANTHGGHLIFGVQNQPRTVQGLADPQYIISKLTEQIKARIDPAPRYTVYSAWKLKAKSASTWKYRTGRPTRIIMLLMAFVLLMFAMEISRWRQLLRN